eukprot:6452563-Ditylum_brightwellii.AAC.1
MKYEKKKKHKVQKRVISHSCKERKKRSTNVMQEDWDEHDSMINKRCEKTEVLIVKPDAVRMRRMR